MTPLYSFVFVFDLRVDADVTPVVVRDLQSLQPGALPQLQTLLHGHTNGKFSAQIMACHCN